MFGPLSTKHFPALGEHGLYQVHLVTSYTHLGGVLHYTGEVRARKLEGGWRLLIKHFANIANWCINARTFPLHKRAEIFRSLIMSRLFYGADSWALWDSQSKMKLHSAVMRLYRRLLGRAHILTTCRMMRSFFMWVFHHQPTSCVSAGYATLDHFAPIGDIACWGLLNRDRLWRALIEDDMKWVWRNLANTCDLGDPMQHMQRWFEDHPLSPWFLEGSFPTSRETCHSSTGDEIPAQPFSSENSKLC